MVYYLVFLVQNGIDSTYASFTRAHEKLRIRFIQYISIKYILLLFPTTRHDDNKQINFGNNKIFPTENDLNNISGSYQSRE